MGEEGDKGLGMDFGKARGLHFDDPRLAPLLDRCADLGMPVNIHVADPIWMYQRMDETNDGMMNAVNWRLDDKPGIVDHSGMIDVLERAVRGHPRTTFVACHLANLDYDLDASRPAPRPPAEPLRGHLGPLRGDGRHPPVRRARSSGATRTGSSTARTWAPTRTCTGSRSASSRPLDEHFYAPIFEYHWSYSGFGLADPVLKKLYRTNALQVAERAAKNASRAQGR